MDAATLLEHLRTALPSVALEGGDAVDQPFIVVPRAALVEVSRTLRDHPALRFSLLAEMTAVDYWPHRDPRFDLVYHLACLGVKDFPVVGEQPAPKRLRMKVRIGIADPVAPSLVGIWPNANWYEREVYDLFGVAFEGHPDLRRILMPDEWEGHPARKDSPVQVKVPVQASSPLQVSEKELLANFERLRVRRQQGPDGPAGQS